MPQAQRDTDLRVCGATTVVVGQSTVKVNGLLWAVQDDICTHGNGQLNPSGSTVKIEGKLIIVHSPDDADPDDLCIPLGPPHCDPDTGAGSPDVSAY